MLGQRGSIHTIVFGLVLLFGFVAALGWPQYAKHREIFRAKEALSSARNMAQAQSTYATTHNGQYAADWAAIGLPLTCPQVTQNGVNVLECEFYDFYMQDGKVYAKHKNIAKWLTVDVATGQADCSHEEKSIAGSHICARVGV